MRKKSKILAILSILSMAIFLVLCYCVAAKVGQTLQAQNEAEQLQMIYHAKPAEQAAAPSDWSGGMLDINPDYVGWLQVAGTRIDLPVVQADDNEVYLRRDIYGEKQICGTCFMDYRVDMSVSGNRIIYGHNMMDGTMFDDLDEFKDAEFFKDHGLIRWREETGDTVYQVFAVAVIPGAAGSGEYLDPGLWADQMSEESTEQMIQELHEVSALWRPIRHDSGSRYLFLVTCDYTRDNGRLLIAARNISTDRKEQYDETEHDHYGMRGSSSVHRDGPVPAGMQIESN